MAKGGRLPKAPPATSARILEATPRWVLPTFTLVTCRGVPKAGLWGMGGGFLRISSHQKGADGDL